MIEPAVPDNEEQRLAALHALDVLDTAPEERFDRITRLALQLFEVPIAYVAMVDENRQWFKSACGLEETETTRAVSFCGHAILGDQALVIRDARQDERFHDNPLVTGPPMVRFYAGRPLRAPGGEKVGTFCLVSPEPRDFAAGDLEQLDELAELVERELHLTDTIRLQRDVVEAQELADELLNIVVPLGIALSAEQDYKHLLETTLAQAMSLSGADAGLLLLRDSSGALRRGLLHIDGVEESTWLREAEDVTRACGADDACDLAVCEVARTGDPVNTAVPEAAASAGFADLEALHRSHGYRGASALLQPLVGSAGHAVGVLQLLSSEATPGGASTFSEATARATRALSALAGAALEGYDRERRLRQRIESLELQIDEAKRDRQVQQITESEFFTDLLERASTIKQ